jgi:hypothetical protein
MALVDYLPDSYMGSIVFTTRTRKAAISLAGNNMIQVNEMDFVSSAGKAGTVGQVVRWWEVYLWGL